MNDGQVDAACKLFKRSLELKRTAGAQLNLARCEEELNHLPRALSLYEELHDVLPSDDPRVPIVQLRIQLLKTRVARVTLVLEPESPSEAVATTRDGSFPLNESRVLMPGEHRVTVSAPGHRPMEYVLQLDPAEALTVRVTTGPRLEPSVVELGQASPAATVATAAPQTSKPVHSQAGDALTKEPSSSVSPVAYGVLAFGGVSLLVSGVSALLVLQQNAIVEMDCSESVAGERECSARGIAAADRGRLYANIATASFVVGITGVAGGTYLLVHGASDGPKAGLSASLTGHF